MANNTRLSPAELEVQDYLQQVSAGQAGVNPRAQTLARSSRDPIAQRAGQRAVGMQLDQNQRNIEDQQREAERQARENQREAERQQREAEAAQRAEEARRVRAAAAVGVDTETDIETGRRSIKRHDDGTPVFKPGPVGQPVQAPVTTTTQLTREDGSAVPARNPLIADTGSAASTVTAKEETKPVWQQTFRDDRGRTVSEPLKEQVDPKTAERYVETPDAFGRPQRRVVGTDPTAAELLKLQKEQQDLDGREYAFRQANAAFKPKWDRISSDYEAAKKRREGSTGQYVRNPNPTPGQPASWGRYDSQGNWQPLADHEKGDKFIAFQKERQQAEQEFRRAEAEYMRNVETSGNHDRVEREIKDQRLSLAERKRRVELGLPADDGGIAREIAEMETGLLSEPAQAAAAVANEEIEQPRPIAPTGEDALRKALAPIAGENLTLQGREAGQTYIYRDGESVGKIDARLGTPSLILRSDSPADVLAAVSTAGEPGGLQTYVAENRERMTPQKEAGWMASVLQVTSQPTQGPLAEGQEQVPQQDPNEALKAMGASYNDIVAKARDGRLSIGHAETLMQKLYGDTLKAADPKAPETFNTWLNDQSSSTKFAWQKANGTRDVDEMRRIRGEFVSDWYAQNQRKPGVTFEMQREARGAGLPEKTAGDIAKGLAADTGGIVVDAAGSMLGMFSGIAGQGVFALGGLGSEDMAQAAKAQREVLGRGWTNFNSGLETRAKRMGTKEGRARDAELQRTEFPLKNLIENRHQLPPDEFKQKFEALAKDVGDRAYNLQLLNVEDGWAVERSDFDIDRDRALRSALVGYATTGDSQQWEAFRRRLRMDKGQRQAEETMAVLTEGQGRFSSAFSGGVMAPPQETLIETVSTVLTLGAGKLLSRGAKVALEGAEAAAAGTRLARMRALASGIADDFAQFGKFSDTLANPASKAQRLVNRAVDVAKTQAVEGVGEAAEETVSALADPNATAGDVAQQAAAGFVGSIFLGPLIGGAGAIRGSYQERFERAKSTKQFSDWYNRTNADTPGFQPMTPPEAEAALALVDPVIHKELADAHAAAVQDLKVATEEMANAQPVDSPGTPSDSGTAAATGQAWQENAASKLSSAFARAQETSNALANYIGGVVEAAQSTKGMEAPARARTLGLVKVATGRTDLLTGGERQAITGLQTRDGAPYFADVAGQTVFTAEGRAELLADQPLVGALVQTDESRALIEASTDQPQPIQSNEQDTQGQLQPQGIEENAPAGSSAGQMAGAQKGLVPEVRRGTEAQAPGTLDSLADLGGAGRAITENFYRGVEDSLATTGDVPAAERGTRLGKAWSIVKQRLGGSPEVIPRFMAAVRQASSGGGTAQSWAKALNKEFFPTPDIPKPPASMQTGGTSMQPEAPAMQDTAVPMRESPASIPVQAAVARAEAKYPALKGRFTIDATGERVGSGGAYMQNGQVVINLADTRLDLAGYDGTEQQDARLDAVLDEEIVHLAQLEAVLRAGGSFKEDYGQIWEEFTPQQQRAASVTYGDSFDALESWQRGAETVRMLVQQRVDGRVTELTKAFSKDMPARLIQLLRSAVEFLRELVTKGEVPPRVRQAIDSIEGMLAEFQGKGNVQTDVQSPAVDAQSKSASETTEIVAPMSDEMSTPAAQDANAPMRVIGMAIKDAAAADKRLTRKLRRELELATEDLDAMLETLPAEQRRPFFDQAIRGWLDERFPLKAEPGQPAGVRAREILNSGEFPTLSAVFGNGKIAPRPNVISLVLARKRSGNKLTEREKKVLRNTAEWDDAVFQNQFENAGNGRVAREILALLTAKPGEGIAPDVMASTVEEGATASDLWAKIGTELNQVATGQRAAGTSLDPNREWTDAEIAAAEAARAAMPEPEPQVAQVIDKDDDILFSSPNAGAFFQALHHPSFATAPNPDNYQPYEESRAVVREIARENGIRLVRPRDPDHAAERAFQEASGLGVAYFKGGKTNSAGFVSKLAPELIFLSAEQKRFPLYWVIAHETVHAAQKDARLGKLAIWQDAINWLEQNELEAFVQSLLAVGYKEQEIITELPAHLLADAAFTEEAFDIGALARAEEIKAAAREWYEALPSLKPEVLDAIPDDELVRLFSAPTSAVEAAAAETDTAPTDGQKEAGNYRKGKVSLHGMTISIENPRRSIRSGTSKAGKAWSVEMPHHYGYFLRTEARDGDHVDVFVGPDPDSTKVWIVNQINPGTGRFDEHKVMMGFNTRREATAGYQASYTPGWKGLGSMVETDAATLKAWLENGDTKKPATEQRLAAVPSKPQTKSVPIERESQLRLFSSPANQAPTKIVEVTLPDGFPDERANSKAIGQWAMGNLRGRYDSPALGGEVGVTRYGIGHSTQQGLRNPTKLRLIAGLPELIREARIVRRSADDTVALHAVATMGGQAYLVRITVEQRTGDTDGPWSRFYDLKAVEIENAPGAGISAFPSGGDGSILAGPERTITLAQLADIVKKVEGGDVTLGASPTNADSKAAVEEALASMSGLHREVFSRISDGASEAEVMKRFGLSGKGVTRLLNEVRARIAVATEAAGARGLQPAMRDGKIDGGRPDLAYGAQPAMAAIDQARNDSDVPGVRGREEVIARAEQMLADNYQGTFDAILQAGADERQLADHEVAAAKIILAREMIDGGAKTKAQQVKLAMLAYSYRDIGTETARSLAMRFDPHMRPAERHAQFLAEVLTTPDAATRKAMKGKPKAQKEAMLAQWLERVKAIKDELLAQGIDIDASLAAFRSKQEAERQAKAESPRATAVIDEQVKKLTKREKAVIESIRAGATWEAVSFATGMDVKDAKAIYKQFYADINDAMAASAKRYLEASLAASPMSNAMRSILDDLGVPHPDDIANDAADLQKRQKEKTAEQRREADRKSREKKREQALGKPVGKGDISLEEWAKRPPASWRTLYETEMKALRVQDRLSFDEWAAKEVPGAASEWQREMDLRQPAQRLTLDQWAAREFDTWKALWQTEMDKLRPQSRIPFEEWAALPATREKFMKQPDLFAEPINEATGTFDLNDPLAMKEVMNAFAIARGSKLDALMEYWRASILTGPQTHIVNAGSNLLHVAYHLLPRRGIEALINNLLGLVGQGSEKAATFAEFAPMAKQLHRATQLAARNAIRSWKLESRVFESYARADAMQLDFTGLGAEYVPPALGGKIGKIMRSLSFRAMSAADEFFKTLYGQFEVAGQSHRIAAVEEKLTGKAYEDRMAELMKPGSKAWLRAVDGAKRVTFQEDLDGENPRLINRLDQLAQLLKQGRSAPYIGRPLTLVLPFIDTPTNIFKQAIQMSPLGGFLAVADGIRSLRRRVMAAAKNRGLLKDPKHSPEQLRAEAEAIYDRLRLIQDLTNQTLGWAAFFALQGLVDGDDDELPVITGTVPYKTTKRGERDNAYAVMPPMTIRIPGTGVQFSYSRIEPFATMLASSTDLLVTMNRHGGMKPAVISETMARFKDQVSEKTFLQGLSSIFNAIEDPDRFAERMASNIATGFVPNIIRQPLRESDNAVRDQNPRGDDGFFASVAKRVGYSLTPGAAPAKIDVWGNEVPSARGGQFGGTEWTDMIFRILDPTNATFGAEADPIDKWIFHYNLATAEERLSVEPISNAVSVRFPGENKRMVAITAEEQAEANRNAGKAARSMLGDEWETTPLTGDNADRIKEVVRQVQKAERARLRAKLLAEGPEARK